MKIKYCRMLAGIAALIMFLFSACAKNKIKTLLPQPASIVSNGSSIRLFNFYNVDADITVNNIPLTNYGSSQATQTGVSLFPGGKWPNTDGGSPFTIPSSLLDKQGRAHVIIAPQGLSGGSNTNFNFPGIDTILQNDPQNPKDFYALFNGTLRTVARNSAAPSQPDHFKIRVLNLMEDVDQVGFTGKVTLTYADGSPVSPVTSGVDSNSVSGYVELPLGAYQFKVFISNTGGGPQAPPDYTKQLAELPAKPNFNGFDQTLAAQPMQQEAIFPKIRTFKAGATYTIAITKATVVQHYGNGGDNLTWFESVNAYRIITEQSPASNSTYACLDAVNALRLPDVNIQVDGDPLGTNLAFGQYAGHKVYIWGNHHVTATDHEGRLLAAKDIDIQPNDYLTAWAYLNSSGMPDIVFSSTDMTSTIYLTNASGNISQYQGNVLVNIPDDGTNGSIRVSSTAYNWQSRFLNLSEDIPYVTFGNDNVVAEGYSLAGGALLFPQPAGSLADSSNFAAASLNLTRGETNVGEPFITYPIVSNLFFPGNGSAGQSSTRLTPGNQILVFQSQPGPPVVIPGLLLADIPGLRWTQFIANPSMYSAGLMPIVEPGFYSVAVIGNVSQAGAGQAKMIYIKHNQ